MTNKFPEMKITPKIIPFLVLFVTISGCVINIDQQEQPKDIHVPPEIANKYDSPVHTVLKPIYRTESRNIINRKISIGNNMISNNGFILQRRSKIIGNFYVDNGYYIDVKIYSSTYYNEIYSTGSFNQGEIYAELEPGSYYIAYINPSQNFVTVTTNVDAAYDVCTQNCD